jgi:2-methylisocitrate lyase-like PEP mutase family enzyme
LEAIQRIPDVPRLAAGFPVFSPRASGNDSALRKRRLPTLIPAAFRLYDGARCDFQMEVIMDPISIPVLAAANEKSRKLRELVRAPEILVMPGAYDVLSAILFERMGFKAIQGTSGGIAAALGYPDGEVMSRDQFIQLSGNYAAAVGVPFNADGERGYGDEAGVRDTVRALVSRGVAGMNLEDGAAKSKGGLVDKSQQLHKLKTVMDTKRELQSEFFLNARVDAFHVMPDDPKKALAEAIERGNAYAEAGGDCIFYLGLHAAETIGLIAKEVKAPVSILAGPQSPSVKELQDLGVARVSYGSGFLKAAISGARRLAQEILENGTCSLLKDGMQTPEIAVLVARRK